jgi:hypothetical protein
MSSTEFKKHRIQDVQSVTDIFTEKWKRKGGKYILQTEQHRSEFKVNILSPHSHKHTHTKCKDIAYTSSCSNLEYVA